VTNHDPSTPESTRSVPDYPHHSLGDDECRCDACMEIPDQDREPTDAEISRMMDQPDEAERRAESWNVYFDLK
jgi:hypothetical protein